MVDLERDDPIDSVVVCWLLQHFAGSCKNCAPAGYAVPASVGSTVPSPAPVVIVNMFGGIVLAVAVSSDCNRYWLLLVSLDSVVWQLVWRPRHIRIGVVWLVASCRQMLISVCLIGLGLWAQLGRQAAWRPRCIVKVSSDWWHRVGSCCCDCLLWALVLGSCSVVKLLGGRGSFELVSPGWWHRVRSCCDR